MDILRIVAAFLNRIATQLSFDASLEAKLSPGNDDDDDDSVDDQRLLSSRLVEALRPETE